MGADDDARPVEVPIPRTTPFPPDRHLASITQDNLEVERSLQERKDFYRRSKELQQKLESLVRMTGDRGGHRGSTTLQGQ